MAGNARAPPDEVRGRTLDRGQGTGDRPADVGFRLRLDGCGQRKQRENPPRAHGGDDTIELLWPDGEAVDMAETLAKQPTSVNRGVLGQTGYVLAVAPASGGRAYIEKGVFV